MLNGSLDNAKLLLQRRAWQEVRGLPDAASTVRQAADELGVRL